MPLDTELSTALIVKVANVAPAGMVTVAGKVAELGALLLRLTTKAEAVGILRVTLPVVVPRFSEIDDEVSVKARLAVSASTINVKR